MSWERYNSEAGLLLYLKTGHLHPVVASHMDRRGIALPYDLYHTSFKQSYKYIVES